MNICHGGGIAVATTCPYFRKRPKGSARSRHNPGMSQTNLSFAGGNLNGKNEPDLHWRQPNTQNEPDMHWNGQTNPRSALFAEAPRPSELEVSQKIRGTNPSPNAHKNSGPLPGPLPPRDTQQIGEERNSLAAPARAAAVFAFVATAVAGHHPAALATNRRVGIRILKLQRLLRLGFRGTQRR